MGSGRWTCQAERPGVRVCVVATRMVIGEREVEVEEEREDGERTGMAMKDDAREPLTERR